MSFDLYFLPRSDDGDWAAAMERLEEADGGDLTADDLATWGRIVERLATIVPEAEAFSGEGVRSLDVASSGMQISMYPSEFSITTAYWHEGEGAELVVERLRQIAAVIEDEAGLVAYDPQADAPFLTGGDEHATGTFDQVADQMRKLGVAGGPSNRPKRRWWPFGRS